MIKEDKGGEKMRKRNKAQSILEYIIVFIVIVAAFVAAAAVLVGSTGNRGLGALYNKTGEKIMNASASIINLTNGT
jgi:uncharacterized protein (UPF0333 family)